jgi:hypothetical protein
MTQLLIELKFCKVMQVSLLSRGIETRTLKKGGWNKTRAVEMKYSRTAEGCTRIDRLKNEGRGNDLGKIFKVDPVLN